ncbi:FRG domain-containing protein [Pedobacter sp. LMG 31464]|uniref:FRG domain-containing protein n=1 Tax=Pedobacter planticolens TaxID=2679964 RepID=A0A923DVE1_9SPHI|nr:FRG domain-containing protein [Pedobacter planticolens]MBB2144634.1 FRG domain-containing protein [Pedobacter planticolens]
MSENEPIVIKNVSQYIDEVDMLYMLYCDKEVNSELLFRGQTVDLPLIPKIGRLNLRKKTDSKIKTEKLILDEFRRGILPLSEFKPENNWDLLALAQHHGLPTRLLDWSCSALIGLWFAVCKPPVINKYGKALNGIVWVFAPTSTDYRTDTTTADPLNNNITKVFKSTIISKRISAQSGVFTVHKILDSDGFVRFENNKVFKKKLIPIHIKGEDFASIRKQLSILGINNASVFPDIDGFCKNLEWRYSKLEDEKF